MLRSDFNKYVYLTDRYALLGHAVTDFARAFGKFEGEGKSDFASLYLEKITALYTRQIAEPVSVAWSRLPRMSSLVTAAKEGLALSEPQINSGVILQFEESLRGVVHQAVPALRELALNPTVKTDTLQGLTSNLMAVRDEAAAAMKSNGEGIFSVFTRRITDRKAAELQHTYFHNLPDGVLAEALSLTACDLCHIIEIDGADTSSLDEIGLLVAVAERKVPVNAHSTLSRLNDVGNFIGAQSNARFKAA